MTPHQLARFALREATENRSGPMKPKGPLRSGFRLDDGARIDPAFDDDDARQLLALELLAQEDMPWQYLEPYDAYDAETR